MGFTPASQMYFEMIMKRIAFCFCITSLMLGGCADEQPESPDSAASNDHSTDDQSEKDGPEGQLATADSTVASEGDFEFKPLNTSAGGSAPDTGGSHGQGTQVSADDRIQAVMSQLKPLQVMLGNWRGTTRKEYEGFKAVDSHEWVWDLRADPSRPALSVSSDKSPYVRSAKLTWDPSDSRFLLKATDAEGVTREYAGDYTDPVHEIIGPDDKPHRVFRLELTQTAESAEQTGGETWQIAFAQQENNRYLLEVAKRRGSAAFRRFDTVSTQREGTSFALSDSDYGEKTCIISQGLGTTAVSYKGKTYWVCCSGCKAAFEEDPETWIARAEKRAAEKK